MPNAFAGKESEDGTNYTFTVKGSISTVQNFYTKQLPDKGWILLTVGEGNNGNRLIIFTKGNDVLSVSIVVVDETERIMLVMFVLP